MYKCMRSVIGILMLGQLVCTNSFAEEVKQKTEHEKASLVWVGDVAPDFTLTDINGKKVTLKELRGKVVMINFFATWCGPCRREMPHLQKLWEKNRDNKDFVLLVVGREETKESLLKFMKEHKYTLPMLPDPKRTTYSRYAKKYVPRTYIIAPDGKIAFGMVGFDKTKFANLEKEMAKQLKMLEAAKAE